MTRHICSLPVLLFFLVLNFSWQLVLAADSGSPAGSDPLVQLLVNKGVLTAAEAQSINQAPASAQHDKLLALLREKGVISADEFSALAPASAQVSPTLVASTTPMAPAPQPKTEPAKPAAPTVVPAVAPLRVLQLEPSPPSGLIPDIKLAAEPRSSCTAWSRPA